MTTIKNATELTQREWYLFLKLYTNYFTKSFVESNKNRTLSKIKLYLCGQGYAERTLGDIKTGHLTSFVALEPDLKHSEVRPIGFMTGYEADSGMLNLLHVYSEGQNLERLTRLKSLYAAYAREAKSHGMVRVQTVSDLYDPVLTDTLESLHFDQGNITGTEIDYGRAL